MNAKDIEKILIDNGVEQSKELSKALEKILEQFSKEDRTVYDIKL